MSALINRFNDIELLSLGALALALLVLALLLTSQRASRSRDFARREDEFRRLQNM